MQGVRMALGRGDLSRDGLPSGVVFSEPALAEPVWFEDGPPLENGDLGWSARYGLYDVDEGRARWALVGGWDCINK